MKNISKFSLIIFLLLMVSTVNAQISVKDVANDLPTNSSAFIDFSKIYYNSGNNDSKGMIIPSVNLGTFVFQYDPNSSTEYPTFFDGMVVYNNTASATTVTTGDNPSTSVSVVPGFYYFSNPNGEANGNLTSGVWKPIGDSTKVAITDNIIKDTNVTVNGAVEKVAKLAGTADGTSSFVTIGTGTLPANTVVKFRKAVIYDAAGDLVFETSAVAYNKATNVVKTGSGFINQVLPAGTYSVEVFYTP